MPPKRPPAKPSPPARADVDAALDREDYRKAVEVARRLVELAPAAESRAFYLKTLAAAAAGYFRQGKAKAVAETLRSAGELVQTAYPAGADDAAVVHAKTGAVAAAVRLSATPRVLKHVADYCMRTDPTDPPAEVHAGLTLVQQAFREYEAGRDDAAKEALQAVGLTSPFLEWKVLLRGLMAYAAGDNGRAVENWQRLSPEFLPATLAAPLRGAIDPPFRGTQTPAVAADLRQRADVLVSGDLLAGLRAIQKLTGRDQKLQPVWKEVDKVAPQLRTANPTLFARLGAVLYEAIIRQGEPNDLRKYRTLFPPPADDPYFHRLEALACEGTRIIDEAVDHWQRYERWLAEKSGWPADLATRARAIVLHRVGDLLDSLAKADADPHDFQNLFQAFLRQQVPKRPAGDPDEFYRRSAALAPDWPRPAYDLFDRQLDAKKPHAAEQTAKAFLARRPQNLPMLERLAELFRLQRRMPESLAVLRTALAANPLDGKLADAVGLAILATARQQLIAGDLAACERLLAEDREAVFTRYPIAYGSLTVTLDRKAGRKAKADEYEPRLFVSPELQLCAAYDLAVDGLLAKLTPAQRKGHDARLKAAFATPDPHPLAVTFLYSAWLLYEAEGLVYRGQPTHEKKIVALAEASLRAETAAKNFESLVATLARREQYKTLQKMLPTLIARFPASPLFPLLEAQRLYHAGRGYGVDFQIARLLDDASRLAEASASAEHRMLLDGIDRLRKAVRGRFVDEDF